jgi:hypothetical protein
MNAAVPSACHHVLATPPFDAPLPHSLLSSYGILFTLASPSASSDSILDPTSPIDDVVITSLGFYVDIDALSSYFSTPEDDGDTIPTSVSYEVYILDGYYADPSRGNERNYSTTTHQNTFNGGGLPVDSEWDYRGDLESWTLVAEGGFEIDDLIPIIGIDTNVNSNISYFQIPFAEFESTSLPSGDNINVNVRGGAANDRVQSFYLTLKEVGALYYSSLENWESLNDGQQLLDCGTTSRNVMINCENVHQNDAPILQIGEGVASYPFYTTPYFYTPRKFMGAIYVESTDCPTASPTLTPSNSPFFNSTFSPHLSLTPSSGSMTSPSSYIDTTSHGCHRLISTDKEYIDFVNETTASYGIIFPIQTDEEDADGVWITSFGFYIDFKQFIPTVNDADATESTINYQVYTMLNEGFYANPNRTKSDGMPQEYDYRGNFSYWKSVASGTISKRYLTFYYSDSNQIGDDGNGTYFFSIPWDRFEPTYVSSNGGVQSFYLTLNSASLVYKDLERKQSIGKVQKDDNYNVNYEGTHPPKLLIGEGVIGYPFNTMSFLYSEKQFIGKIYYEIECPSQAPSAAPSLSPTTSSAPSNPTALPSDAHSINPSASMEPTTAAQPRVSSSALLLPLRATYQVTIFCLFRNSL